jgi:hypothetical protein
MSSNQQAMVASIKAADAVKVAAVAVAETARQGTVQASGSQVGYIPGFPTGNATYVAAVAAANKQKVIDIFAAELARQGAVFTAKDLLRSQGEVPF